MKIDDFERIETLDRLLTWRADHQADHPAFAFLGRDLVVEDTDSYATLAAAASGVAARLTDSGMKPGEPVVIACSPGLAFVRTLWGIWLAGGVAVPSYPVTSASNARRLRHIMAETGARLIVAARPRRTRGLDDATGRALWLDPDEIARDGETLSPRPSSPAGGVALIQYTSGSVAEPKGVLLTHRNILRNAQRIQQAFFHTSKSRGLIWLPPYHDMGLMGGIIQPVYAGFRTSLMAPRSFLRDPLNWLKAISLTRATTSGGPNFAYEACLRVPKAELEDANIDLGPWEVAFNGAEPVSPATLHVFARTFEPYGFLLRRFMPCYGLAEATLHVVGASKLGKPTWLHVDREALTVQRVTVAADQGPGSRALASCGHPDGGVRIVHPDELRPCPTTEIGEIWVSGDSIGTGYCGRPALSRATFEARLDGDQTRYLRTGDLGFLHGGELYVTGRMNDLIIIRGRKHHPEDIEATIGSAVGPLNPLAAVALAVPRDDRGAGEEGLLVVQEIDPARSPGDTDGAIATIRSAIAAEHGIAVTEVVLVRRGTIQRTASGKPRRGECRDLFLSGRISPIESWRERGREEFAASSPPRPPTLQITAPRLAGLGRAMVVTTLTDWLIHVVSDVAQIPVGDLDPNTHFGLYGIDSLAAISVTTYVSDTIGIDLDYTVIWDYPNFTLLAEHLAARLGATPSTDGIPGAGPPDEETCPTAAK